MGIGTAAAGFRESASASIRHYFGTAAERLSLHPEMQRLLSVPFRELAVEISLRRENDRLQLFHGYRVQHNGVRGPTIGPIRLQAGLEIDTLRAAAESMTWRCAVANVPFGGAAGGIACNPGRLSAREFERLVRRYTARIHHGLGFYQDLCVPGPGVEPDVMSWIGDEYSAFQKGMPTPVLGKPPQSTYFRDRAKILGDAIAALTAHVVDDLHISVSEPRVAVSSVDRSAFHTALALEQMGYVIIGVSEERGGLRCSGGIDMQAVGRHLARAGTLQGLEAASETFDVQHLDCEILVMGAPQCALNAANCAGVRAKLVIEASELVVSPAAEQNLSDRGVLIVPDLVGATAEVLLSNAEWSNVLYRLSAKEDLPSSDIDAGVIHAYEQIRERARRDHVGLRTAAYSAAIERVARSERLRVA